jgi:hypothetical protein
MTQVARQVSVFKKINLEYGYSQHQIIEWSGVNRSVVSRFLSGDSDIGAGRFMDIIFSMPQTFQQKYWRELIQMAPIPKGGDVSWKEFIYKSTPADIQEILDAIADRYTNLYEANTTPQEPVTANDQEMCKT